MRTVLILVCYMLLLPIHTFAETLNKKPLIHNQPVTNINFTGREQYLSNIMASLKNSGIATLVGTAGIGKTQIAKAFVDKNKKNYDIIWWVDADKDILTQFKNLVVNLLQRRPNGASNIVSKHDITNADLADYIQTELIQSKYTYLIIFDNVADYGKISQFHLNNSKSGKHIMATSKNFQSWDKVITIEKFNRKESLQFLGKILVKADQEELDFLAESLGDYPLALAQAAAFIKATPTISIKEYIELFNNEKQRLWAHEAKLFQNQINTESNALDKYSNTVASALAINIEDIRKKSPNAFSSLALISFLDNESISEEFLEASFKHDPLESGEAIRQLLSHALLYPKNMDGAKLYSIHEIQRHVVLDLLNNKEKKFYLEKAIYIMDTILPKQLDNLTLKMSKESYLLNNIERLLFYADKLEFINNEAISINIRYLEYYLCTIRNLEKAKDIISLLEKKLLQVKNISKAIMARYYSLISSYVSWANKDYIKGIEIANKAKELFPYIDFSPEETLMVYNRLVENYYLLGDVEQATMYSDLADKLIKETKGFLGNKDAFYNSRARILADQGNLLQAEVMLSKAIEEIRKYSEKDDSLGVIFVRLSKIALMEQRGAIKEAYQDMRELEKTYPALFDLEKPHYIKAFAHILYSEIALSNGNINEASRKIKAGIQMLEKVKEVNTRFNTMALIAEADILMARKLYKDAQHNYLLAAEWYKANLKKQQIFKVAKLFSKLVINSVLLKDVINAKKYFSLLKKDFGIQHKVTVETVKVLNDRGIDIP